MHLGRTHVNAATKQVSSDKIASLHSLQSSKVKSPCGCTKSCKRPQQVRSLEIICAATLLLGIQKLVLLSVQQTTKT